LRPAALWRLAPHLPRDSAMVHSHASFRHILPALVLTQILIRVAKTP
jgi:predicted thioesterase